LGWFPSVGAGGGGLTIRPPRGALWFVSWATAFEEGGGRPCGHSSGESPGCQV